MSATLNTVTLVSSCGLYCGTCYKYKKGKCPGCAENEKASWCKIRVCTKENGYHTCAECTEFADVNECKKFNTLFSKLFAFVFKSDRKASLQLISDIGREQYASQMVENGQMVIKRK